MTRKITYILTKRTVVNISIAELEDKVMSQKIEIRLKELLNELKKTEQPQS